jgi:endonuclease YncB( thermonuclease family)
MSYAVRVVRDDGKVRVVTGFPRLLGAQRFAEEMLGDGIIAAQIEREDGEVIDVYLEPETAAHVSRYFRILEAAKWN